MLRGDGARAVPVAAPLRGRRFVLQTPLMWLDKAEAWQLAEDLGGKELVELIVGDTHTCYLGERGTLHAWGHGCGGCPACSLRARGFERNRARKSRLS